MSASNSLATRNFEKISEELFLERSRFRGVENRQAVISQSLVQVIILYFSAYLQEKLALQEKLSAAEKLLKESNLRFEAITEELFSVRSTFRLSESIFSTEYEAVKQRLQESLTELKHKEEEIKALEATAKNSTASAEELSKLEDIISSKESENQKALFYI